MWETVSFCYYKTYSKTSDLKYSHLLILQFCKNGDLGWPVLDHLFGMGLAWLISVGLIQTSLSS